MSSNQGHEDFPVIQAAIYGVALSLDAFLLNGIPYGVIHRDLFNGFLEKTADNLRRELANLEEQTSRVAAARQAEVSAVLAAWKAKCQQMIDRVTELYSFRSFSLEQLRSTVSQVPPLRMECVRLIQDLERCFQTPKPFYPSRSNYSTYMVNGFISNLERIFTEEWTASAEKHESTAS